MSRRATMASAAPLNIVALISGDGSNLQVLLDNIAGGVLSARVAAVISDQSQAFGLQRAARAKVPALVVERRSYPSVAAFQTALLRQVEAFTPELVVLAGFMQILPARFIARFAGRVMNIHPSLLPKFKGLNTHQRALNAGETRHGASVHWVTAELDGGPIIAQAEVGITPADTAETLRQRVLAQEHRIYSRAIQRFAQNRRAACAQTMPMPMSPSSP